MVPAATAARGALLATITVVALVAATSPGTASATTLMTEDIPNFGNAAHGEAMKEAGYSIAAAMGAKFVRIHTGRDSSFTWQGYVDPFVEDARRRGFEPYLTLTYRRRYRDGPDPAFLGVPTPAEFGAWCGDAANRYTGKVSHFGVFNEPNYFGDGMSPALYNQLYRACYSAIKTIDPSARVYYGEIAADEDSGDPCAWVTNSLSSSNPTAADGIAIHTYQWTTAPESAVPGTCRGIGRLADWNSLINFWSANGGSLRTPAGEAVPLLITEHGYCAPHGECPAGSSGGGAANRLPESTRANYAARAFDWAEAHGVSLFSYYHLFSQPDAPNRWDTGIVDLFTVDGWLASPTLSVNALKGAAGGHGRLSAESDVNGDGIGDLVTLRSDGTAWIYQSRYSAELYASTSEFSGTMDSAQYSGVGHYVVDVADVGGDGRADLVTLTSGGSTYVYPGEASGGFGNGVSSFAGTMTPGLAAPTGHQPIAVADVDGDGLGDFVTFSRPHGSVFVYPGGSSGAFGFSAQSFAGTMDSARFDHSGHYFIDVADVTGDGLADLVTLHSNGSVYTYRGRANGTFSDVYVESMDGTMDPAFDDADGHEPVAVADVTGDRRADFVSFRDGHIYVYPGQLTGGFGPSVTSFAGTLDSSLFDGVGHEIAGAIDADGDGYADLVTARTDGNIYIYRGLPSGRFHAPGVPSLGGSFVSHRFQTEPGHQLAIEKPFWRRLGCQATGC